MNAPEKGQAEQTPAVPQERLDVAMDMQHETMSRDEQVRWCALQASIQLKPALEFNDEVSPLELALGRAEIIEHYLRTGEAVEVN